MVPPIDATDAMAATISTIPHVPNFTFTPPICLAVHIALCDLKSISLARGKKLETDDVIGGRAGFFS